MKTSRISPLFWAAFLTLAALGTAAAQTSEPILTTHTHSEWEPLQASITNFFEQISNPASGPRKALDEILKNSPFEGNTKEEMINVLAEKIGGINAQFGDYVSYEHIGTKEIGKDLVVFRYLYKCRNYPIVWYFIFYRPLPMNGEPGGKVWQLIHLYYDSQLNVPIWDADF